MKLSGKKRWLGIPLAVWTLVAAGCAVFVGANAHLMYVAFTSQPDCVPHLKEPVDGQGIYRAANSAC
jgi:hypothetical protein